MQPNTGNRTKLVLPREAADLQQALDRKDAELAAHQMRVSKLEALHRLAQDSALKCEADLVSCHEALTASEQDKERLLLELDSSKCGPSLTAPAGFQVMLMMP